MSKRRLMKNEGVVENIPNKRHSMHTGLRQITAQNFQELKEDDVVRI